MQKLVFALLLIGLNGCGWILNPYKDDFSCPKTENGKCVSVNTAYKESIDPADKSKGSKNEGKEGDNNVKNSEQAESSQKIESLYQDAMYKKVTELLEEPKTPLVVPPKAMRVLLLPYKGENNVLYMLRYVYFFVDEPKWVIDGGIVDKEGN